jgi:anti-anti-sigma factor
MAHNDIVPGFNAEKDDGLKIDLKRIDGIETGLILTLSGYIDTYNSALFQKRVTKAIDSGFTHLIFDCGGLNYVSSTGIGSFTQFLKTIKALKGELVLLDVQPKVYEVFQLLGFSQFFTTATTLEDALQKLTNIQDNNQQEPTPFPRIFECPVCRKRLKAVKSGRFRCSGCKTILSIDDTGLVYIG